MNVYEDYGLSFNLFPKQLLMFSHPDMVPENYEIPNEVLFGGAAGGGKSYSMRAISIILALECPGVNVFLFRKTYTELKTNHLLGPSGFQAMLATAVQRKLVRIDSQNNIIQFKNGPSGSFAGGSIIYLRHVQYEKDVYIYQGAEIHVLMIDEATHFSEPIYNFLRGRVRIGNWSPPEKWKKWFPRIICASNPGCVPYGDVLTTNGWVPIQDVKIGDEVYSQNCETRDIRLNLVTGTVINNDYTELVRIKNTRLDIICTSDHRVATITDAKRFTNFKLTPVKDLPNQSNIIRSGNPDVLGNKIDTFTVAAKHAKRSHKLCPLTIPHRDYAELMGWYLSEGCVTLNKNSCVVNISQSKVVGRGKIEALLKRCGFRYFKDSQCFHFSDRRWAEYFATFGKCEDKYIPRELLNSSDIDVLFEALVAGDGHTISDTSGYYATYSERLRDDFSEIAVRLGYIVHTEVRQRKNRRLPIHLVHFMKNKIGVTEVYTGNVKYKNRKETTVHPSSISTIKYSGAVYCIEVSRDHNFFIRQNNSVWLSGNSSYHNLWKHMFVDFVDKDNIYRPKRAPIEEGGMLRQYIPATVYDNPALLKEDPGYIDRLKGLGSPELVKAMLEGNWDIVAGGMFDDLWRRDVHVVEPFRIPKGWYINRCFDWGSSKPFAVLWVAESNGEPVEYDDGTFYKFPPGTLFVIDEWYGNDKRAKDPNTGLFMPNNDIGAGIKYREDNNTILAPISSRINPGPADNSIYTVINNMSQSSGINAGFWGNAGRSRADIFFPSDKSPGSRVKRWSLIRDRLACSHDIKLGKPMERPGLFVFNVCNDLIRTLPTAPRDEKKMEDIDTASEDHLLDALGYRVLQARAGVGRMGVRLG